MEAWSTPEFQRQLLEPCPGDPLYLVLSDLRIAIGGLVPPERSRILDYGCGGSPYRSLFVGDCTYHRADLAGGEDLDFEYGADGLVSAEAAGYDFVLSTQVLEHVENPSSYLKECYRLLKPGGRLLLTTHGIYEDHACPNDYWRWTTFGLRRMVEEAGFKVGQLKKLTTGPRAATFLVERELARLNFDRGVYWSGIKIFRWLGARRLHKACDSSFPLFRVVDEAETGHDIYICIAVLASR
jgi:SAM-dependent methyltransferase